MPRIVLLGGGKSSLGPWSWSYWWFQGKRWNKILHPSTCGRLKYNSYKANLGAIIDTPGMRDLENAERNSFSSLFYFWLAMASIQEFKRVLSALDLTQQSIEWISEINALCPEWKDIPITSAHSLSVSWLGLSLVLSVHNLWGTSIKAATTSSAGDKKETEELLLKMHQSSDSWFRPWTNLVAETWKRWKGISTTRRRKQENC